jgi:Family of unknown function (DUF6221)
MSNDDLIAFVTARLDEAAAKAWLPLGNPAAAQREHIARQDPGRVLRGVEADRKLLDLYERARNYRDQVFARPEPRSVSDEMRAVTQMMALEQVMRLRGAVFSDHPDYRPEWKP